MCISILLALVVFLLLVSKILPPTSVSIPLIAKYLLFTFIMNIVTIVITVVIINWNFRTPRTHRISCGPSPGVPPWTRWLPRIHGTRRGLTECVSDSLGVHRTISVDQRPF